MKKTKIFFQFIIFIAFLSACSSIPDDVTPVKSFDLKKYTGTWYEIARMDSRFEKNLVHVTATYGLNDDGSISVKNRGLDTNSNKWSDIEGKARAASDEYSSMIEVSFFGPFYAGYNVIALDTVDYSYAMVCGSDKDYLWILARYPKFSYAKTTELIAQAKALGFDTDALVMVPKDGDVE